MRKRKNPNLEGLLLHAEGWDTMPDVYKFLTGKGVTHEIACQAESLVHDWASNVIDDVDLYLLEQKAVEAFKAAANKGLEAFFNSYEKITGLEGIVIQQLEQKP